MDQRNKSSWLSTAGLFLVGFFVVGLAVVTSKPFEERFGYAETAMVSEVLPDSTSDTSGDDPVKVAQDESGEAAGDTASESKDAAPNDAADESASKPEDEPPTEAAAAGGEDKCCKKGDETPPFELIAKVPPGELHNPYDWQALKEEHKDNPDYLVKQFRLPGCNECHGGGGGGGFCPALSQGVWFWGNTDDVLFRLIALGSKKLEESGFTRYQYGTVKAPMPEMGHVIKTSDHLWQIISFIRSINPPETNPPEKVIPGKYTAPAGETKAE